MSTPDRDYPRWMFHRTKDMVIVKSEDEEAALGPEWSRTQFIAALEPEHKPLPKPNPEPEPDEEDEEDEEPDEMIPPTEAPPAKKRARPAAPERPKRRVKRSRD